MKKIVINVCYGGFSLSREAMKLGRELSGNPNWGDYEILNGNSYYPEVKRDDPILVRVVEILGEGANGACAQLQVKEVDGKYRICEYDGTEWIETPEDMKWEE